MWQDGVPKYGMYIEDTLSVFEDLAKS